MVKINFSPCTLILKYNGELEREGCLHYSEVRLPLLCKRAPSFVASFCIVFKRSHVGDRVFVPVGPECPCGGNYIESRKAGKLGKIAPILLFMKSLRMDRVLIDCTQICKTLVTKQNHNVSRAAVTFQHFLLVVLFINHC